MKKIIITLLILTLCAVSMIGCGATNDEIKSELRGTWYYDSYASVTGEHCHQIYEFNEDDKVEVSWVNDESPSKSSYKNAMYSIEQDHIAIIYYDGSKQTTIDFVYKNGKLQLFDRGSDGSIDRELNKK